MVKNFLLFFLRVLNKQNGWSFILFKTMLVFGAFLWIHLILIVFIIGFLFTEFLCHGLPVLVEFTFDLAFFIESFNQLGP